MSQYVGRRVQTPQGHGVAVAYSEDPTYLVELDDGHRLIVGAGAVKDETFDDYLADLLADPSNLKAIAPGMTPKLAAMTVLDAVWERINALPHVDRYSVAMLLNVKGDKK